MVDDRAHEERADALAAGLGAREHTADLPDAVAAGVGAALGHGPSVSLGEVDHLLAQAVLEMGVAGGLVELGGIEADFLNFVAALQIVEGGDVLERRAPDADVAGQGGHRRVVRGRFEGHEMVIDPGRDGTPHEIAKQVDGARQADDGVDARRELAEVMVELVQAVGGGPVLDDGIDESLLGDKDRLPDRKVSRGMVLVPLDEDDEVIAQVGRGSDFFLEPGGKTDALHFLADEEFFEIGKVGQAGPLPDHALRLLSGDFFGGPRRRPGIISRRSAREASPPA